jgi:hypothetical protein
MEFLNRNEAFWEAFTESIMDEVYKSASPSSDYLNIGGWISDLEAGDVGIEEMALGIAKAVHKIYDNEDDREKILSNRIWISDVLENAYNEAEKAQDWP